MTREEFIKKYDLVDLMKNTNIKKDIVYATKNNFTGRVLYDEEICFLRRGTYNKLLNAIAEFNKMGFDILIWDTYRPLNIQKLMWVILPDERYVSNPAKSKSMHCKGNAIDMTLIKDGKIVEMPTGFDAFGDECHLSYFDKLDEKVYNNVSLLQNVMLKNGFNNFETEWWHFSDIDDYDYIKDDFEWNK